MPRTHSHLSGSGHRASSQASLPGRHTLSRSLRRSGRRESTSTHARRRSRSKSERVDETRSSNSAGKRGSWQDPDFLNDEFEEALKELELSEVNSRHEVDANQQSLGVRLEELTSSVHEVKEMFRHNAKQGQNNLKHKYTQQKPTRNDVLLHELDSIKKQIDDFAARKHAQRSFQKSKAQKEVSEFSNPLRLSQLDVEFSEPGNSFSGREGQARKSTSHHALRSSTTGDNFTNSLDIRLKELEDKYQQSLGDVLLQQKSLAAEGTKELSNQFSGRISNCLTKLAPGVDPQSVGIVQNELQHSFQTHVDTQLEMVAEESLATTQQSMRNIVKTCLSEVDQKIRQLSEKFTEQRLVAETALRKQLAKHHETVIQEFVRDFQNENEQHLERVRVRLKTDNDETLRQQRAQLEQSLRDEIQKVQQEAQRQLDFDQKRMLHQIQEMRERMKEEANQKYNSEQLAIELQELKKQQEIKAKQELQDCVHRLRETHSRELERASVAVLQEQEHALNEQKRSLEVEHARQMESSLVQLREALNAGAQESIDALKKSFEDSLIREENKERQLHQQRHKERLERLKLTLREEYAAKQSSVRRRVKDEMAIEEQKVRAQHEEKTARDMLELTRSIQQKSKAKLKELEDELISKRDSELERLKRALLKDSESKESLVRRQGEIEMEEMLRKEHECWGNMSEICVEKLSTTLENAISRARDQYRRWAEAATDNLSPLGASEQGSDSSIQIPSVGSKQIEGFFKQVRNEHHAVLRKLNLANQRLATVSQKLLMEKREVAVVSQQLSNLRQRVNHSESTEKELEDAKATLKQLFAANESVFGSK